MLVAPQMVVASNGGSISNGASTSMVVAPQMVLAPQSLSDCLATKMQPVASKQSADGPATADAARGLQDALFELKVECPVKVSHKMHKMGQSQDGSVTRSTSH